MNIEELLANPRTLLEFVEPRPGREADGRECVVYCGWLITIDSAVKIQRAINFDKGYKDDTASDLLKDFIAVNWAVVYEPK